MLVRIWELLTGWRRSSHPGVVVITSPPMTDIAMITDWFRNTSSCPDCEGRMFYRVLDNSSSAIVMVCGTCTSEFNFMPGRVTRLSAPRQGRILNTTIYGET